MTRALDHGALNRRRPRAAADGLWSFPTRPSRYRGRCARCKARYEAGDPVLWLAPGKVWCRACCVPRTD